MEKIPSPDKTPASQGFVMPAEWEAHEATWLSWPKNPLTFPDDTIKGVEEAYCQIIAALSDGEKVRVLVDDEKHEREVEGKLSKSGANFSNLEFARIKSADVWARDYAPSFLLSRDRKQLGAVKWEFNAWGEKYDDLLFDNEAGAEIARVSGARVFRPNIVMEGGSIDVNGNGAVLTTEQCLLNKNRNPKLMKQEIEDKLKENLGCEQVIWLKQGIEGDDTDGHIDDFCRFAPDGVALLAQESGEGDANSRALFENRTILEAACEANEWELQELPMPSPLIDSAENRRLPASFANFYVGNKVVLLPVFNDKNDEVAREIVETCFSGREIVPIFSRDLVYGYGGVHCITQQQPKVLG